MLEERLRSIWADSSWRFVIIGSALYFFLEIGADLSKLSVPSVWWGAMTLSVIGLAWGLSRHFRPPSGELTDVENLTPIIAVIAMLHLEALYAFTSVGPTFVAESLNWPFILTHIGVFIAARLIAPHMGMQLLQWLLWIAFASFWLEIGSWYWEIEFPDYPVVWSLIHTGVAVVALWLVRRGFSGPIGHPLNIAAGLYVFLLWWLEYGIEESGAGSAANFGDQEIYWPWLLITIGLADLCATIAFLVEHRRTRGD